MMNIYALFDGSDAVYMWTFTFPETLHAWLAPSAWNDLSRRLYEVYPRSRGVRVMEFHQDHGIHFHVLIDRRICVHVVRRMCKRAGFGRVHVCRIHKEHAGYVAKYVNKDREMPRGLRRWAAFGTRHHTRCRDLEMRSEVADAMRAAYANAKQAGKSKSVAWAEMTKAKHEALLGTSGGETRVVVGMGPGHASLSPSASGEFVSTVGGGAAESGCDLRGRDPISGVGGTVGTGQSVGEVRPTFGGVHVYGLTQCNFGGRAVGGVSS